MKNKKYIYFLIVWILISIFLSLYRQGFILLFFIPIFISPFLRAKQIVINTDERELFLEYKSSHFAYLSYYLVVLMLFADYLLIKQQNPPVQIYLIAIVPGLIKWLYFTANKINAVKFAIILSLVFGIFWLIFALLSHGISIGTVYESVFGLSLILSVLIGLKFQKVGGVFLLILSFVFFLLLMKNTGNRNAFTTIIMFFVLTMPPFISGCLLFMTGKNFEQ